MSDLFEEVEEDLKRDRAIAMWKKYGPYAVAAGVGVIALSAGVMGYLDYRKTQAEKAALQFVSAADVAAGADKARALASFSNLAREAPGGYATLARIFEAGLKGQAADHAAAITQYRAVAGDSSIDRELRDAATVMAAMHLAVTAGPADIERELASVAAADNPWRHVSRELIAVSAVKAGDIAKARDLYAKLADDTAAPQALRARAAEMLAALGA